MLHARIRVILALCVAASVAADRGTAPEGAACPRPAPQRRCSALLALGLAGVSQLDALGPCAHLIAGRGPVDVDFQILESYLDISVRGINLLLPVDTYADLVKTMAWHGDSVPISGYGVGTLALAIGISGGNLNQQQLVAQAPGVDFKVGQLHSLPHLSGGEGWPCSAPPVGRCAPRRIGVSQACDNNLAQVVRFD